jgi:flagellar motility protein MotE (MotC chaperone)
VKSVRLLPIVIAAGAALLMLKSVGLVTEGGYVLSGASTAFAAGAGSGSSTEAGAEATDPVMRDASPTLDDGAPTLPLKADSGHGDDLGDDATPAAETAAADCAADADGHGAPADEDCAATAEAEASGELKPMMVDGAGNEVPLTAGAVNSEDAVLERLSDRRGGLDAREAELDMRLALIEAAEQRIDERTAALEALESRIEAMVKEKKSLEEEQFVSIIAMYESMKARDAAPILNQLDMTVLLRVARAMSPRKMAPILAAMDPLKARDLTANMAIDRVEPTIDMRGDDFANLPQIVGE